MNKIKQKISQLSIKQKWTFVSALTIIVSYALISGMVYIAMNNWLINDEERNATTIAQDVQSFFLEEGAFITIQDIQNNTSLMNMIVDRNQTVRIYNQDQIEIIRINDTVESPKEKPSLQNIIKGQVLRKKINGQDVFIVYSPIKIGAFTGYMELIHPLDTFHSLMKYMLTLLSILGIGAVILASTLSSYIASLLLKPINHLRNSMAQVRDSGIEQKVMLTYDTNDEIGDLIQMYNEMLAELQMSFNRQQQFVQDASHELRTPIQAIEGHLSLLNRWGKSDPTILNESIKTSLAEVARMKQLMEELLLLAKNDPVNKEAKADVHAVIQQVVEEQKFVYPQVTFDVSFIGEVKNAFVTTEALTQIIRNIVENGIRYNEQKPNIQIKTTYFEDIIELDITDNGIGIEKQHIPFVFDRFYRVDASRHTERGGTGLGLSITKMLADKYNIDISIQSDIKIGTSFKLKILAENTKF